MTTPLGNIVKAAVHRRVVFGIPRILRRHFLYDRKRLPEQMADHVGHDGEGQHQC